MIKEQRIRAIHKITHNKQPMNCQSRCFFLKYFFKTHTNFKNSSLEPFRILLNHSKNKSHLKSPNSCF